MEATRKIVFGLGNTLNNDEGMGVFAMQALEERLRDLVVDDLEFIDGGVLGLNLLPWVEEASHLLVLDAINASKEPGTVIELKSDEIPLYTGVKMSDHQILFQEVLGLAKFREKFPENLHMVGAQPIDLSVGVELSDGIKEVMPEILDHAEAVLRSWGLMKE
ncbi:MAG: HyaD/HybD family hydrogenase maturation endopeptidase [Anaerolineae bacterium]|jgi:hydrogenase maturation protease|nr:HyaD/HybD family hydrogenase maturation endopeptidase [Anaerolineae bacterium]MBT7188870.1 HyaD/HybD family hydrogenase maturation endopeptidase [Anaerolineae bacterium]MBT7783517.1 HyaD/HybD family hydrogenase maturation endopeptidase [Anaerolineae bacterium]